MGTLRILSKLGLICSFAIVHTQTGWTATTDYELSIGAVQSDNIGRTSDNEVDETAAILGVKLEVSKESRRVEVELISDLHYLDYLDDTFDSEVVGSLEGTLNFSLAPEVLEWVVENTFGVLQNDPFRADNPGNRETVNRLSTGPNLQFRIGSNAAIEIGGRYYSNQFEESESDNEVVHGGLSLVRVLSSHRSISLNVSEDRYEFDNTTLNTDYDRRSSYFSFASEMSRGSLVVNVGYNEILDTGEDSDGVLFSVLLERLLSPSTSLSVAVSQSLTDAAESLTTFQATGLQFGETLRVSGVSDPFEQREVTVQLEHSRSTNRWYVAVASNSDEYVNQSILDVDRIEIRAGVERAFASSWRLRLLGSVERADYDFDDREDDDLAVVFGLSKQLSRKVRVDLDLSRFDRDSSDPSFEYTENRVGLSLSYGTLN